MDGRERLAKVFGDHVRIMGWSQEDVAALGGPSTTTQTKITAGSERLSPQTCKKIDAILAWPPGTALKVQEGVTDPPNPVLSGHDQALGAGGFTLEWRNGQTVSAGRIDVSVSYVARNGLRVNHSAMTDDLKAPMRELLDEAIASAFRNGGVSDAGSAEAEKSPDDEDAAAPSNVHELKHQRMVDSSHLLDEAAVGGVLHDPEWIKTKEAREAEKRAGEESQDDGGFDPA